MQTTDETTPNFYAPGPLNPQELADVLRTALVLVREDHDHDVFTLLDVLAADRYPGMSRDASYQVARAILKFLTGIGAFETREPVLALHLWHRRNLDASASSMTLEWALAETIRQFDGVSLPKQSAHARTDSAPALPRDSPTTNTTWAAQRPASDSPTTPSSPSRRPTRPRS